MGPWSLSRMHSWSEEYDSFSFKNEGPTWWIPYSLRIQTIWVFRNSFSFIRYSISWRNCDQFHLPPLHWIIKVFSVEINIFTLFAFLFPSINLLITLLIWKRKGECKEGRITGRACKQVIELTNVCVFWIYEVCNLLWNALPLFLQVRQHSVHRFQSLWIELRLYSKL